MAGKEKSYVIISETVIIFMFADFILIHDFWNHSLYKSHNHDNNESQNMMNLLPKQKNSICVLHKKILPFAFAEQVFLVL